MGGFFLPEYSFHALFGSACAKAGTLGLFHAFLVEIAQLNQSFGKLNAVMWQ